jgi:hypothetical protein
MKRIALALTMALALGACSSSSPKPAASSGPSTTAGSTQTSQAPTSAPAAADPKAPEVNPAGDIPDNQVYVAYTPPSGGFSVKVPEGWARTEAGGAVTFTDKLNSVRMETVAAASAPTVQSAQQQEVPAIQASVKQYEAGKVTTVTRKAGTGVLITYRADAAPDPVTGKVVHDDVERYEFWKVGKTVILTLSGPQGADNVDPWRIVTDSFSWQ